MESVAALPWNQRQPSHGISGSFRVERVAALAWNQWQDSPGIGGSFGVEYALWSLMRCECSVERRPVHIEEGCHCLFPRRLQCTSREPCNAGMGRNG